MSFTTQRTQSRVTCRLKKFTTRIRSLTSLNLRSLTNTNLTPYKSNSRKGSHKKIGAKLLISIWNKNNFFNSFIFIRQNFWLPLKIPFLLFRFIRSLTKLSELTIIMFSDQVVIFFSQNFL